MADSRKYSTNLDLQGNSIINGGFEQVAALPLTGYDGETVSYRGKLYTWFNGKWNCVADDLGGVEETREEQFTFQPTANDESVKDGLAIIKSIKGNTVVANQLFDYSTIINDSNATYDDSTGIFSCTPINQAFILVSSKYPKENHYYLISFDVKSDNNAKINVWDGLNYPTLISATSNWQKIIFIEKCINSTNRLGISSKDGAAPFEIKNIKGVDLTQMFGGGNEPTAEVFERLYPNISTEYNTGSLLNMNADSVKSVGFNAFNGNYAQVLGGQTYYLNGEYTSLGFKENEVSEVVAFELPADRLYTPQTNGYLVAEGSDICVNLSHSGYRNGEYEPYKESIANLPIKEYFPDGMKSAGEVRDEIIWDEGLKKYKAIQRVGSVEIETLEWRNTAIANIFYASIPGIISKIEGNANILLTQYLALKDAAISFTTLANSGKDKGAIQIGTYIGIKDPSFTDADLFKQSLQGQILYYELETPIETIIDDYDLINYEVSDFGTEKIIADEPTTPIVADIQYGFNAVDEIRNHRFEIRDLKKLLSRGLNLNGVTVNLGDTSIIPAYITYNDALYPMRIQGNWLQIYRNGVWGNLFNLASEVIPSSYIEEFKGDWYNPNVLEYVLSDDLTIQLISGKLDFRSIFSSITGFAGVKLSLQTFSPKEYDKSLDNILNAVTGYIVYVENDIDTMFNSGNNVLVKLNFDGMNRVTIECYTQR